jgi:hypothetical protein
VSRRQPDTPRKGQAIGDLARAILPLLTIFAVAGLGVFLQRANNADAASLGPLQRLFAPGCGDLSQPFTPEFLVFTGGFYSFTAAAEFLFVTQIGVIVFAALILVKLLPGWRAVLAGLLTAGAIASAAALIPRLDFALTTVRILEGISRRCPNIDDLLIVQERFGAFAATLLACALSVVLFRPRSASDSADLMLARRMRGLAAILYAGTILLVISLLRLGVLYDWILTTSPAADQKAMESLNAGLMRVWGCYYTTILAAVYLPAFALLRAEARSTAEQQNFTDAAAQESWMAKNGLTTGVADILPRILAILAPVLVGELHKLTDLL